jgi:hypothetical protein
VATERRSACPDGITDRHFEPERGLLGRASVLPLLLLGGVLAAALLGLLGGRPNPTRIAETPEARLELNMPTLRRNGEFFEGRIRVTARRNIDELVLAASPSLWRDLTVNTMIPAAADESFEDGLFRFTYGPLEAGQSFEIKIDFQINPALFGGTAGEIAAFDGDRRLAGLHHELRVLP